MLGDHGLLAVERDAPFLIEEYRTLNRCLDNAIAAAVTEFGTQRDIATQLRQTSEGNQRLGYLMHELRNALSSGMLAVTAMKSGNLSVGGATGSVLQRSHAAMARIINRALDEVKADNARLDKSSIFAVDEFIREAHEAGQLDAEARGLKLVALEVDPGLAVEAHRDLLLGALANLIGNALKFTLPNTTVTLTAHAVTDRVLIEVSDHCGGLRQGDAERIFVPFSQRGDDKTGVGLGLSIARESVCRWRNLNPAQFARSWMCVYDQPSNTSTTRFLVPPDVTCYFESLADRNRCEVKTLTDIDVLFVSVRVRQAARRRGRAVELAVIRNLAIVRIAPVAVHVQRDVASICE